MRALENKHFEKILPLVADIPHSIPIVYGVVEGNNSGQIFVDSLEKPTAAYVVTQVGYNYVVGSSNNSEFNSFLEQSITNYLSQKQLNDELLLFPLSDSCHKHLRQLLGKFRPVEIQRKTFSFNEKQFRNTSFTTNTLGNSLSLCRIDEHVAARCPIAIGAWGSVGNFLQKGFGFSLIQKNNVIGTCYSIFVGNREAEIDIFVDSAYRKMGIATLVATAFIDHCLNHGLIPVWSCWPERKASIALAKKLGFVEKEDVTAFLL